MNELARARRSSIIVGRSLGVFLVSAAACVQASAPRARRNRVPRLTLVVYPPSTPGARTPQGGAFAAVGAAFMWDRRPNM